MRLPITTLMPGHFLYPSRFVPPNPPLSRRVYHPTTAFTRISLSPRRSSHNACHRRAKFVSLSSVQVVQLFFRVSPGYLQGWSCHTGLLSGPKYLV